MYPLQTIAVLLHGGAPPPDSFIEIWMAITGTTAVSLLTRFVVLTRRRKRALAQLASQHQLVLWPKNRLPPGLDLAGTPLARQSGVYNHYEGLYAGANLCLFDLTIGGGKSSYRRSAIAVLAPGDGLGWDAAVPGLNVYRLPRWVVFTRAPQNLRETLAHFGLIPVPEFAAALKAIRSHLDRLSAGR